VSGLSDTTQAVLDALRVRNDADATWRADLRRCLKDSEAAPRATVGGDFKVDFGMGYGAVAKVPWVVVLRSGQSPREGQYPVLLFAADGSAAYLSLNQGTEQHSLNEVRDRTARLRRLLGELPRQFDEQMNLRAANTGPRKYEAGNLAAVRYDYGEVPEDGVIEHDLRLLIDQMSRLEGADEAVDTIPLLATTAWIFQSIPEQYDLEGAVEALKELTWLVNRYPDQIHVGNRVYLWETGPNAGIVAVGRVLTEPATMEESDDEASYRRKPEAYEGPRRRVRVAIDDLVQPRLTRARLRSDEVLSQLPNLRFAQGTNFPVTPEQDELLLRMIGLPLEPQPPRVVSPTPISQPSLAWLQEQTLWEADRLEQLIAALRHDSRQLVLAGPPGTGKTWVAQALARYLVGDDRRRWRIVQFHPSYTYEQFIEGLRPVVKAGGVQFERVDGVVLDVVKGMASRDELTILLIDEMNRGNLPKVFGELMYLFEYRDQAIDLQYSRSFALPSGLRFVGTMNTADRSIRSIDVALRRRFDVYECPPERAILERYFENRENQVPDLFDGFEKLNAKLTDSLDRHHTIGHSFFMSDPMTPSRLKHVWEHKISPLIEEYFFDQPDLAATFALRDFWPSIS